uniref:Neuroglobin isoform 1 n=1 Tax=Cherax cainii TaxID=223846 RepID=A0A0C5DK17_9EUCA|nr:neuroglobin isoform 1 [Cherax cainii]AJO70032.1 neuroglobin isoform 2 [Cherax cainii]
MGCHLTKGSKKKEEVVLPEPPEPASPDPRLPLTARQKFNIIKSWKGISRAIEPTGVYMFVKLFENNAELINLFTKFKQLRTRDEQAESLELAEHAKTVMSSIDEGIKSMDNVDYFFDVLHQIGASHHKIPGFKKEYFWKIEIPFLEAVRLTLDDRYTENMDNIYRITIKFLLETVVEGYEKAEKRESNENVKNNVNSTEGNCSKGTNGS